MDQDGQIDSLAKAVKGMLLTPNEGRKQMDQQPLPGGDTIWMQQQDVPMEVAFDNATNPPEPPALPAPEPQKALPAGEAENTTAERMARHVARRARTLRVRAMSWN